MDLKSAIMERTSRRKYELDPVDGEVLERLEAACWECNRAGGLGIQIKIDDPDAFSGGKYCTKYNKRIRIILSVI